MSQKRKRMTRREFLRDAALATGTVALAGVIPAQVHAGRQLNLVPSGAGPR